MLTSTTDSITGKVIEQHYGIVLGETAIADNVLKELISMVKDLTGGRSSTYERVLREAQESALHEMTQRAEALGANAVVGVSFACTTLGYQGHLIVVTCSGTAVRVG